MTIDKLSYQFCRSLPSNDNRAVGDKTRSESRTENGSPFKVGSDPQSTCRILFQPDQAGHAGLKEFPDLLEHPVSAESLTEAEFGRISPLTTNRRSRNVLTTFSSS
jgi:hypothetical protein